MKKWPTRPTTDLAKEALFNILTNRIDFEETTVLDLFGGSGGLSMEAISRGSSDVTFVDNYYGCVGWMKQVAKEYRIEENLTITKADVRKYIKHCTKKFDLIIADPPYALAWLRELPGMILDLPSLLSPDGLLVIEHGSNISLGEHPYYLEHRQYGQSVFTFFQAPLNEDIEV